MSVTRSDNHAKSNATSDAFFPEAEAVREAVRDTVKGTLNGGVSSVLPVPPPPETSAERNSKRIAANGLALQKMPFAGVEGAAAFFDVDNTLMYGASVYWLGKGMSRRGILTSRDVIGFAWKQARFRFHGAEHHGHISSVKASALEMVAGFEVRKLQQLCEEVYDRDIAPRILEPVAQIAAAHIEAGQEVWLVTASPVELAEVIAQRLGLTGAVGTVAEVKDGCYTGRLVGDLLHGPAKAARIAELAQERGLDLSHSTAYSDSANDLPMLERVGNAVAVNPDARLAKAARERGWNIRDFRRGRRAARIALPATALAGVVVGGLAWRSHRLRNREQN
ncbi:HAD family hydrolase [Natronoglycomyces albus]|uniref:HAD-IB family hydrolase n=1 Tax=Natronoglycomyces albus TaxID=2811108 RepID=A0A895XIF5_9ACTN|nr:HAD-IB family hydrolase [Natronoglycomyces albus]QSB05591.1 HAD-IB family hydrolase [Natronoglycomyces albus]